MDVLLISKLCLDTLSKLVGFGNHVFSSTTSPLISIKQDNSIISC